jgi:hypothetical protein
MPDPPVHRKVKVPADTGMETKASHEDKKGYNTETVFGNGGKRGGFKHAQARSRPDHGRHAQHTDNTHGNRNGHPHKKKKHE